VRQIPFLKLKKSCGSAVEAAEVVQEDEVDLIFLDIQMPHVNGLQFLKCLDQPPLVIVVTAHEKYAVESFNLQTVDYIVKPFQFDRFLTACTRAAERFRMKKAIGTNAMTGYAFFVPVEYRLVRIVPEEIDYIEGRKDYINIHLSTASKPVMTRMSLKAVEAKLPADFFIRTHKSFLVPASKITVVKKDVVCVGNVEIPVSASFRGNVTRRIQSK
jgi:DNA-binding LytR/AlgR family response regulator